ncbi:restriction endonuclease [Streptomyces tremellae]|uniref:restriction endonuclease n=1 Tax=Streptomyces tremellae TaxID=1124239 RepID=UPI003CD07614
MLHDPEGLLDAELSLDRAPHEALVTAVLAWKDPDLAPRDYEQIALQLTGHARAVAADVRRLAAALPKSDGRGALAELILMTCCGTSSSTTATTAPSSTTTATSS